MSKKCRNVTVTVTGTASVIITMQLWIEREHRTRRRRVTRRALKEDRGRKSYHYPDMPLYFRPQLRPLALGFDGERESPVVEEENRMHCMDNIAGDPASCMQL